MLTRRACHRLIAGALVAGAAFPAGGGAGPIDRRALAAFLDDLLPAEGPAPAASALGVPSAILALAGERPEFGRFLADGLGWLDGGAGPAYADLAPSARARLLDWMAGPDADPAPARFYSLLRGLAVELYFARPEAVTGLPLNPAPQPRGYPPPWG